MIATRFRGKAHSSRCWQRHRPRHRLAFAHEGSSVVVADGQGNTASTVDSIQLSNSSYGGAVGWMLPTAIRSGAACSSPSNVCRLDIAHNAVSLFPPAPSQKSRGRVVPHYRHNFVRVLCMKHEIPRLLEHGGGGGLSHFSVAGIGVALAPRRPRSSRLGPPSAQRSTTPHPDPDHPSAQDSRHRHDRTIFDDRR